MNFTTCTHGIPMEKVCVRCVDEALQRVHECHTAKIVSGGQAIGQTVREAYELEMRSALGSLDRKGEPLIVILADLRDEVLRLRKK